MVLESPICLVGLLPWAAVVLYLLPGKGRAQAVPFLEFWKGVTISPRRAARRVPPISIVLILIALLLAVLAAAKPARVVKGNSVGKKSTVPSTEPALYVAITAMGARTLPHPQVMVRLENHSDHGSVQLKVAGVERLVLLPARGESVNVFVDVDKLEDVIVAQIPEAQMTLKRDNAGVKIVVDRELSDSVKRIAAIYSKDRPGGVNAKPILISSQRLDPDQTGVWIQSEASGAGLNHRSALPPEIMRNVSSQPTAEFVAVQEIPSRQVWVSADLREWEKTTDFVIFFGNVFDWLAAGSQEYVSVTDIPAVPVHEIPYATQANSLGQREPFTKWVIFAALGCMLLAVLRF